MRTGMGETLTCDVAVVGASPAGLRAAWAAAIGGADVILLDARKRIGDPPAPAVVAFEFLWRACARVNVDAVRHRVEGARVASPAGHALTVAAPALVLDRARFDLDLAREAEAAGARLLAGAPVRKALAGGSLRTPGAQVRAGVVVFADGAGSLGRRFLTPVRDPDAMSWGVAQRVRAPSATGAQARFLHIGLGSQAPFGRSQLTPLDASGAWAHWTFYRGPRADAEARAARALALDAKRMGWADAWAACFEGVMPDPVYTIPRQLVGDGVMVAGGAAGQGGIEAGLAAGELAGRVAARAVARGRRDAAALGAYERVWMRRHLRAFEALREGQEALAALRDADLDAVLAPWHGRRVPVRALSRLCVARLPGRVAALARLSWANPRGVGRLARTWTRLAFRQGS